jgi:hypothetical protein
MPQTCSAPVSAAWMACGTAPVRQRSSVDLPDPKGASTSALAPADIEVDRPDPVAAREDCLQRRSADSRNLRSGQVTTKLLGAAVVDQRRTDDQTVTPWSQLGLGPDFAEQDLIGELDKFRSEVTDELLRQQYLGARSCAARAGFGAEL